MSRREVGKSGTESLSVNAYGIAYNFQRYEQMTDDADCKPSASVNILGH